MKQLVIDTIIARFKRKQRRLNEVHFPCLSGDPKDVEMHWNRYQDLKNGHISIEEYLAPLSDKQLLDVFESQCCQFYR